MNGIRITTVVGRLLAGAGIVAVLAGCSTATPRNVRAGFQSSPGTPLVAADEVAYYSFGMDVVFARSNVGHASATVDADGK